MGVIHSKQYTSFSLGRGKSSTAASEVIFDITQGEEGVETPPSNDSTSRRSPPFFQKRLANKQMLKLYLIHPYHSSSFKICQSSPDSLKNAIERVKSVKSLWFLQSPLPNPQASPRVEANDRHKQAHPLSTCRKVQMETPESIRASLIPGEWVSCQTCQTRTFSFPSSKLKEVPDTVRWIINQEKSELNLLRCFRLWATNFT